MSGQRGGRGSGALGWRLREGGLGGQTGEAGRGIGAGRMSQRGSQRTTAWGDRAGARKRTRAHSGHLVAKQVRCCRH